MRTWNPLHTKAPTHHRGTKVVTLTCRFISPVFGGGVNPKQFDPVTPVRVPAIRGHLRFWWRATHGDLSLEELRLRETGLFGGVHGREPVASRLIVQVKRQPKAPQKREVFQQGNPFRLVAGALDALAYGAFPLRGTDAQNRHDFLWEYQDTFEIELRYPENQSVEIERALWAWLHFGGLGGRTRRGFGALKLEGAQGWTLPSIQDGWPREPRRGNASWAVLGAISDSLKVARSTYKDGKSAQEALLGLLRRMRQGELGRTPNSQPGRSRWPEPDVLRQLFRITGGRHGRPIHDPRINKFPRGRFGAPIIFHFKTERGEREPPDSTLVPVLRGDPLNRLASPLILRPHPRGNTYEAMALVLEHPAPDGWAILNGRNDSRGGQSIQLTREEARRIEPLNLDQQTFTDPIQAYLARLALL
ncbi:MAG: type III-B CRISPR module RAMP protein Cmr1 [Myxococcales bacterium]|nr:type III-B CRISPR module RAMP protein Cmr1 [Polyangiaceae bacterium]MDW8250183.1 type III-B CRISPR module RAMP protein Cmr1 [Myxococcales bacterium]